MVWDLRTKDGIVIRGIPDEMKADDPGLKRRVLGLRDQIRMADPTSGSGFLQNFNEGMGKAFTDIGRGAAQMFGRGPSAEETRETRILDAPLMKTGGGVAGNVAGNIAAFAPMAMVPGANTVAGAGALGATTAALQPTESAGERVVNMGGGFLLGSGTQGLVGPVAKKIGERAASKEAALNLRKSQNQVADETLRMGREAGYVLPPSAVSDSFLGKRLESIGGKAAIGQEAALRNQPVTDRLAREAASLRPEQPLSKTNMRQARFDLAAPHREIAAISRQAADDLAALQQARFDSKQAWKEYGRQGNRSAYNDAIKAGNDVKRLEASLESHALNAGRPDLVKALKVSREKIAQNHQVQKALNAGTGSVDASVIGRDLDNGAYMTGPLETIGRFQQSYKPYMREASAVPTPGVSKSEALSSALLATGGAVAGGPGGLLAGGLPLLSGPARSLLLSEMVQDAALTPNYAPGMFTRNAAALANPETRRRAALAARGLLLPAIPQFVNE